MPTSQLGTYDLACMLFVRVLGKERGKVERERKRKRKMEDKENEKSKPLKTKLKVEFSTLPRLGDGNKIKPCF